MTDVKKLASFAAKMEWEGGWEGIVRYGISDGTGDGKLDILLEKFEAALEALDIHWENLNDEYDLEEVEDID